MSLVVAGIVAAGAAVLGAAVVALRRHQAATPPALPPSPVKETTKPPAALAGLPLGLDHMVQLDDATRWLRAAVSFEHDGTVQAALYLADEDPAHAVMCFAPPERDVWWLGRVDLDVPPKPPARLELGPALLDRRALWPVAITRHGDAPDLPDEAQLALYRGPDEVALVVRHPHGALAFAGRALPEGRVDDLGHVAP